MSRSRVLLLTLIALIAFAANSILCRLAFERSAIDAASFTSVRLLSGALTLWLIVALRRSAHGIGGSWQSATALFVYAAAFSLAYVSLSTGIGALLLFGAVQATMIIAGLRAGERLNGWQIAGLALALGGLGYLMLPGLSAPPVGGSLLMLAAGIAWGVYSLRGRGTADPLGATAGNFLRAAPLGVALSMAALPWMQVDAAGAIGRAGIRRGLCRVVRGPARSRRHPRGDGAVGRAGDRGGGRHGAARRAGHAAAGVRFGCHPWRHCTGRPGPVKQARAAEDNVKGPDPAKTSPSEEMPLQDPAPRHARFYIRQAKWE